MKKLSSYFFIGLATLLPVGLSIAIIFWIFSFVDSILAPLLKYYFGQSLPGIGFIITIAIILFVGFLASSFFGRKIIYWGEILLLSVPVLGKVYGTIKRIISSLFTGGKNAFQTVVLVEFPQDGFYSIGFVTNENFPHLHGENYSLFIPTTPNPTNGFFVIAPKEKVQILDISVDEGIELIISAGMVKKPNAVD